MLIYPFLFFTNQHKELSENNFYYYYYHLKIIALKGHMIETNRYLKQWLKENYLAAPLQQQVIRSTFLSQKQRAKNQQQQQEQQQQEHNCTNMYFSLRDQSTPGSALCTYCTGEDEETCAKKRQ